jgi:GDP-L-fucose synthase
MEPSARIYVSGMQTPIGSALVRVLRLQGCENLVGIEQGEPDLTDPEEVDAFFADTKPEYVFMAAGKAGGIRANQNFPAILMRDNLLVECNVIHSAHRHGVKKLLYLASSCCYPRACQQPMRVESLMTGQLEPTSEAYALAKLAGIGLCQAYAQQHGAAFVSAIPADTFGPGDSFSPKDSHVVPAIIGRMHEAKVAGRDVVEIWGTGNPQREFVFTDDVADACAFVMHRYHGPSPINLGGGTVSSVGEVAVAIKEIVGFVGALRFDLSKPDGMPMKALDSSMLMDLGWRPKTSLRDGLRAAYEWFLSHEGGRVATASVRVSP